MPRFQDLTEITEAFQDSPEILDLENFQNSRNFSHSLGKYQMILELRFECLSPINESPTTQIKFHSDAP